MPPAVPRGWWIITLALGMQYLFPFEPEARRNAPIEAASPKQTVETSALHIFIASYIPIPTHSKVGNENKRRPQDSLMENTGSSNNSHL